ncbi:MAG: hypothetical protein A3K19_16355 [Lentisphaerae bacterium RIFOXYB12_FULL_65_16]|nr:MAG: hypothetical protein A3K18_32785 [Lentisphaerae bacterium RIFOXYA12_64_32]OGV89016.1 MAG: hypothetical protein A3K19_16355 [Lentisphaerae bacterium RIFOXYB12_FULL_65_16]
MICRQGYDRARTILLCPFVVWVAGPQRLLRVCVGVVAFSLAVRLVVAAGDVGWIPVIRILHWSSLTRLDGLALGSAVAAAVRCGVSPLRLRELARWVIWPTLILFGLLIMIPRRWDLPFVPVVGETIIATLFTAVLVFALCADRDAVVRKAFRWQWLGLLGTYSYGLYVFHGVLWPVLTRSITPEQIAAWVRVPVLALVAYLVCCCGISLLVAVASYHLYEKPFLRLKRYFASRHGAVT